MWGTWEMGTFLCSSASHFIGKFTEPYNWSLFQTVKIVQFSVSLEAMKIQVAGVGHVRGYACLREGTLWYSDAIWLHISGSTMVRAMARCVTTSSHYLNKCKYMGMCMYITIFKSLPDLPRANWLTNNPKLMTHALSWFRSSTYIMKLAGHRGIIKTTQIGKFTWPTWGPPGSCRSHVGPMLAPWALLSG